MERVILLSISWFACAYSSVWGDTFGSGDNQFAIDFVTISGDYGDLGNWSAGENYTFSGVHHGDYRMGKFEITNDQWNKFRNNLGVPVTGSSPTAYDRNSSFTGTNVPANNISWYEAAQFVNWLNTSRGYPAAYKFTGTQGISNYTFVSWSSSDSGYDPANPYRNKNAYYFLPTENEWVKAAYWDGQSLQVYSNASASDLDPVYGDPDISQWNHYGSAPWAVGSGAGELNGTYDMMGNVSEWMENAFYSSFLPSSSRVVRGGKFCDYIDYYLRSSARLGNSPTDEFETLGFRVASVPEPCSVVLLSLGTVALLFRRSR